MSATQTYSQTGLSPSLRQIFPQRHRIVVVSIFGAEKKRHGPLSCFTYQFLNLLMAVLELFQFEQVVALGKIAAAQLEELGVGAHYVRHPASGGARLFRAQIAEILKTRRDQAI